MSRTTLIHLTFSPKYRRPVLAAPGLAAKCEELIRHICTLKGIEVRAIAIRPDHVHAFIVLPPTMSVAQAAHLIKWFSSTWLRRIFPAYLSTYPKHDAFWQVKYFSRSVGGDVRHVEQYINNQLGE